MASPRRGAMLRGMGDGAVRPGAPRAATMLVVALAFAVFTVLDCITTTYGVSHGAAELNPVDAAFLGHGLSSFYALRAAVLFAVLAGLQQAPRRAAPWVGLASTAVTALVVAANLHAVGA